MELQHGRPADFAARLPREQRTYEFLDGLGIAYDRVDHPHADTIEACAGVEAVLGAPVCKNLFLCNRQKTDFYLLMLPGGKVFKTRELSAQLGVARLSFAGPEELKDLLGLEPGSVTVLALMHDTGRRVRLLVDEELAAWPYLGCHPCINTSTLRLAARDVWEVFLPAVGHSRTLVRLGGDAE